MMKNSNFVFALFISLIIGCSSTKELIETPKEYTSARIVDDLSEFEKSAPVNITSTIIFDNLMKIKFTYSGGCENHSFELIGSSNVQKSSTAKRQIKLYHKNNGDSCRERIEGTLIFDISSFAYPEGEIILVLEGYMEEITYTLKE